jgi:hypothetical protein
VWLSNLSGVQTRPSTRPWRIRIESRESSLSEHSFSSTPSPSPRLVRHVTIGVCSFLRHSYCSLRWHINIRLLLSSHPLLTLPHHHDIQAFSGHKAHFQSTVELSPIQRTRRFCSAGSEAGLRVLRQVGFVCQHAHIYSQPPRGACAVKSARRGRG